MALKDAFNRRFQYLRLSLTDVCNFRCSYCLPDGYRKTAPHNFLSLEEIKILVTAMAGLGVEKIRLTGGEPTLRHDIVDIIRIIKNIEGIKTVAMTTNAYRLEHQIDAFVDAGLDALNISVDSLQKDTFKRVTGHDKLDTVLRGIDRAEVAGIGKIKLNAVLMRGSNANELQDYFEFVRNRDIAARFIELMETGDNTDFFETNHVDPLPIIEGMISDGWVEQIKGKTDGPARHFKHQNYQGSIGFITPYAKDFCASCNRLRVSARGGLQLCLFGDQDYDLRPHIGEGDILALQNKICALLGLKKESHNLHARNTGKTQHFASIGG